jgi:hydrogenase nickel incorporation protein HypA/HybF
MHEIRIAADLFTIVREVAEKERLSRVTRVRITFGKMIQVVPEIFEFAFRETVRDSVAKDAELDIELAEIRLKCRKCRHEFQPEDNLFSCRLCNSAETDIIQGKELFIKSIEGE